MKNIFLKMLVENAFLEVPQMSTATATLISCNIIKHFQLTFLLFTADIRLIVMAAFWEPNIDNVTAIFNILNLVVPELVVIDFSRKSISSAANREAIDVEDEEPCIVADDVLTRCQQAIGNTQKRVRILSLAFTNMDDIVFKEVTDKLVESVRFVENNGILDIAFNSITSSSTLQIIQWINKGVKFIYLYGNPWCSMWKSL